MNNSDNEKPILHPDGRKAGRAELFSLSNPFLSVGLKQAGILGALLFLLAFADAYWQINGLYWAARCFGGPALPLLGMLKIKTIFESFTLPILVIVLYWVSLGSLAAKMAASGPYKADAAKPAPVILVYLLGLVLVGGLFSIPLWERHRSPGRRVHPPNAIINNLRQIDGAKEQLAIETKLAPGHVITEADLAPYLKDNQLASRYGTARLRYILSPIGTDPYAVLESDWTEHRTGRKPLLIGTNGTIYTLPSYE
ncbi:MAG: hypothetical protein H0X66_13500 [Verrucomicrobia bacterium]|nr:hypothetical protein [Verrucomicrobiota bacterium]